MEHTAIHEPIPFSGYQKFVIFLLAITQFTVILDFMVMAPLGDMLMKSLSMNPSQFGVAVSAYAFSAGISGLLTAGFADKFDRKKLLLFFYGGFILGTVFCGVASSYPLLVAARIMAGIFGGVIGSISAAIVADLFNLQQRGRVMGYVQMGLGASQVLGVPVGLYVANYWGWNSPFLVIAALALLVALAIVLRLHPVTAHLSMQRQTSALNHLLSTVAKADYRIGYTATAMLSIGGFLMMPFGSAFAVNNLGIGQDQLPVFFMLNGVCTLVVMPLMGRLADSIDKYTLFLIASFWMMILVVCYTNLGPTPFWLALALNIAMMIGIIGRMVPSMALMSAIPAMQDRGAFMSINSSLQQIAGGLAAAVGGMIIIQPDKHGPIQHYDWLGYIMVVISSVSLLLVYRVSRMMKVRQAALR